MPIREAHGLSRYDCPSTGLTLNHQEGRRPPLDFYPAPTTGRLSPFRYHPLLRASRAPMPLLQHAPGPSNDNPSAPLGILRPRHSAPRRRMSAMHSHGILFQKGHIYVGRWGMSPGSIQSLPRPAGIYKYIYIYIQQRASSQATN